LHDQQQ